MIKKITIHNVELTKEPIVLDCSSFNYGFEPLLVIDGIVTPSFIFGGPGSGKTLLFDALKTLKLFIEADNIEDLKKTVHIDKGQKIEVEMKIDLTLYEYSLEIDKDFNIIDEKLIVEHDEFKRSSYITGDLKQTFIKYAAKDDKINKIYNHIEQMVLIGNECLMFPNSKGGLKKLLIKHSSEIQTLFREQSSVNGATPFFTAIEKLEFDERSIENDGFFAFSNGKKCNYDNISSTTKQFYEIFAMLLELKKGDIVIIDGLEKYIHPSILYDFIQYVSIFLKIQIICTCNDTSVLKYSRPDQLFKINNNNSKIVINKASEIGLEIRVNHNLEKFYRSGYIVKHVITKEDIKKLNINFGSSIKPLKSILSIGKDNNGNVYFTTSSLTSQELVRLKRELSEEENINIDGEKFCFEIVPILFYPLVDQCEYRVTRKKIK